MKVLIRLYDCANVYADLNLCWVHMLEGMLSEIAALMELPFFCRHLDLSSAGDCDYTDAEVDQFGTYVQSTTRLTSLELAGTNLSMIVGHNKQCSSNQRFK